MTNPFTNGTTSYYLINKYRKVAKIFMDNETQTVLDISETYEYKYAPLECFVNEALTSEGITSWFKGRGIPSWRDGLDDLLDNLGIKDKDILLNKAFGLSLSDQYWMNPENAIMEWKDVIFLKMILIVEIM